MNPADIATSVRLVLTPLFVVIFYLPSSVGTPWTIGSLWLIAAVAESTDWLDGYLARKRGCVSDFGKLFDPFADVLMHLSFFIVLCLAGAIPLAFLLLVLYREFAITLVRQLTARKGIAMGARMGGKAKTVSYVVTAGAALLKVSLQRLGLGADFLPALSVTIWVLCGISALLAILSFADYVVQYRKIAKQG